MGHSLTSRKLFRIKKNSESSGSSLVPCYLTRNTEVEVHHFISEHVRAFCPSQFNWYLAVLLYRNHVINVNIKEKTFSLFQMRERVHFSALLALWYLWNKGDHSMSLHNSSYVKLVVFVPYKLQILYTIFQWRYAWACMQFEYVGN